MAKGNSRKSKLLVFAILVIGGGLIYFMLFHNIRQQNSIRYNYEPVGASAENVVPHVPAGTNPVPLGYSDNPSSTIPNDPLNAVIIDGDIYITGNYLHGMFSVIQTPKTNASFKEFLGKEIDRHILAAFAYKKLQGTAELKSIENSLQEYVDSAPDEPSKKPKWSRFSDLGLVEQEVVNEVFYDKLASWSNSYIKQNNLDANDFIDELYKTHRVEINQWVINSVILDLN